MKNHTLTRWTLRTAIVLLSGVCVAACSGDDDIALIEADSTEVTSVKIAIAIEEDGGEATVDRTQPGSSFGHDVFGAAFTFASVKSMKLDVLYPGTPPTYHTKGISFTESSPGIWEITVPFLPKSKTLSFVVHAFDINKTEIFTGSIDQSVASNNQIVTVPLSPSNDGATVDLPAIKKITIPSEFVSAQTNNITFAIKGLTGDDIDYTIKTLAGQGAFTPSTGGIKLQNIYGSFVAQYTPPSVQAATDFDHEITISNPRGNAVTTTFSTHVVPQGATQGAKDTKFKVLFNPVINSLVAQRYLGTDDLLWKASVSDDGPAAALSYKWTFVPDGNYSPAPDLLDDTTNPTTLTNYTDLVAGKLTLEVTDGNNGKTTMHTPIAAGQFPADIIVEGDPTGLNSIRAGGNHTCAMLNNGTVRCWGSGASGQLGYGNTLPIGDTEHPYIAGDVPLGGLGDKSVQITTGGAHSCALFTSGTIRCWGKNDLGQLGYGDISGTMANVGDAEAIDGFGYVNVGSNAVKVVAGANHTCAILDTGHVRCWGDGAYGKLGYGNTDKIGDDEQPWQVQAGVVDLDDVAVKDIALGENHTCALLQTGKVRCWGRGTWGQLGYNSSLDVNDPSTKADVNVGGDVVQISAGANHTCALLTTGFVRCWGLGNYGQLGYSPGYGGQVGDNEHPSVAGDVSTDGYVLQVSAGGNHTCVLLATGDVKCWGSNDNGQLGNNKGTAAVTTPPTVVVNLGGSSAMQITTGTSHTCALLHSGKAWCWGRGVEGQLGYANTASIGASNHPTAGGDIKIIGP
ncbi:RCC1 domain-containing protein [Polyangium aurulentum]|uniref:RCC1 domain-containing protein n=1 Tax=Polyangium aurulentum TaxID=2567896 RepID=UPI0010ADB314|nr:RTX toxin [Polyangium aurulentum]UQA62025.1 RTX toxin [Polyangium aurulentum]